MDYVALHSMLLRQNTSHTLTRHRGLWCGFVLMALLAGIAAVPAQADTLRQAAGPAKLVKDITPPNPQAPSLPADFLVIDGITYFSAEDDLSGRELWRTDGTEAGTYLVKDIWANDVCPDICEPGSSRPDQFMDLNGTLIFVADDGIHGEEVWASDGTEAGTRLLNDTDPGTDSSYAQLYATLNGNAFFVTCPGIHGVQLWRTDGTPEETKLVKDIDPAPKPYGFACEDHQDSYALNGALYFGSNDGVHGEELWVSDGTEAGTMPARERWPGKSILRPTEMIRVGDKLYFFTSDSELWTTDGSTDGTYAIIDRAHRFYFQYPHNLHSANGTLFYQSQSHLLASDGTAEGTRVIKGVKSSLAISTYIGNRILFFVHDSPTGTQLWSSDGTATGTALLKDHIHKSITSEACIFGIANQEAFFSVGVTSDHSQIWKTDGAADGTALVKDMGPNSEPPSMCNPLIPGRHKLEVPRFSKEMLFSPNDGIHGAELWRSDGSSNGTELVKDINRGGSSAAGSLTTVRDKVFFVATHNHTVWKSDGTSDGTSFVADVSQDPYNREVSELTAVDDALFLVSDRYESSDFVDEDDKRPGSELWRTDGTAEGTTVDDIYPGTSCSRGCYINSSSPTNLTNIDRTLYFSAYSAGGRELWKRGPSEHKARLVKDVWPGSVCQYYDCSPHSSSPDDITNVESTVFFSAHDGTRGRELWTTNGTTAGTRLVLDIRRGETGSTPDQLTAVGNTLFFVADDGTTGMELWKSDGSAAGTSLVKDIHLSASSTPHNLVNIDGTLYFVADDGVHGQELWRSDGTADGTVLVKDIRQGAEDANVACITKVRGILYLCADDGQHGLELWQSNGTADGTQLVKDIFPGPEGSSPDQLTVIGNRLIFSANDGTHGLEPWRSDGTPAGTRLIQDIWPGARWSQPREYQVVGNTIMFSARTENVGRELWAFPRGADIYIQAKSVASARPGTVATLPIQYGNNGALARTISITAGLPRGLEYVSDTSGIDPVRDGNTLTWRVPNLDRFTEGRFTLSLGIPKVEPGTKYTVDLEIRTADADGQPSNNQFDADVYATYSTFLPLTQR